MKEPKLSNNSKYWYIASEQILNEDWTSQSTYFNQDNDSNLISDDNWVEICSWVCFCRNICLIDTYFSMCDLMIKYFNIWSFILNFKIPNTLTKCYGFLEKNLEVSLKMKQITKFIITF